MSQQKALLIPSKSAPFELGTRLIPTPGPGEVLVKNVAVALNPVDHYVQAAGIFVEQFGFPAVAGVDAAGEIEAVGEGVHEWKKGDRVLYEGTWPPDRATFQEYTIADALSIAKIPSSLSFEQASTIPVCFTTAAVGLYQHRRHHGGAGLTAPWEQGGRGKYAGQPAVVISGSSSVGQFALQLAKLSGFNPIITTASKHNEEYCKAAGATHVVDYRDVPYSELPAAIRRITHLPISIVYDAFSGEETQKAGWEVLAANGTLVTVQPAVVGKSGDKPEDGKLALMTYGSVNDGENVEFGKRMFACLNTLLENGEVKPNNIEVLPGGLASIPAGLARVVKGISGVKLVARIP